MLCPNCGGNRAKVTDSRPSARTVLRRRRCLACNLLWVTYEVDSAEYALLQQVIADATADMAAGEL